MKTIFIHLLNDFSGSTKVLSDIVDFHKDRKMSFDLMYGKNGDGFLNHKSKDKNLFFYSSGRWDIETHSGVIIKLPRDKLNESMNLTMRILNQNDFNQIKIIDIRQKNQVIINEQ